MALTLTKISSTTFGNKRIKVYDVNFDSSYPAGGEPLLTTDVGLRKIEAWFTGAGAVKSDNSATFIFHYDTTNSKALLYAAATASATVGLAQATITDASAYTARVTFVGY